MTALLRSKLVPDRPSMASVLGRGEVDRIAASDPARALALARAIPDAWYRAQALSCVAEHAPAAAVAGLLHEAVAAAYAGPDAYNAVAVMSWPLRAALKRGHYSFAWRELEKVLRLAPAVERAPRAYSPCTVYGAAAMPRTKPSPNRSGRPSSCSAIPTTIGARRGYIGASPRSGSNAGPDRPRR
jgi:hypothetical protein